MGYQNRVKSGIRQSVRVDHPMANGKIYFEAEKTGIGTLFERAQYEYRPYLFMAIALFAFVASPRSMIGMFSAVVLLAVSFVVLQMRAKYRGGWFQ